MHTFTMHTDPAHGWLEVSTDDLAAAGLTAAAFSVYSYRSGDTLFLEEDCDAPRFLAAWEAHHGRPHIVEGFSAELCFVRGLPQLLPPDMAARVRPHTELTTAGEQLVIPGCERAVRTLGLQIGLWD